MKNIHILSTDEQIKNVGDVVKDQYGDIHIFTKNDGKEYGKTTTKLNIYITSDEAIEEWYIYEGRLLRASVNHSKYELLYGKPITLTTDQDLIKDGVQAIDDDFLEWFVKNPSCEKVEVYKDKRLEIEQDFEFYEIIIPKEEPKQRLEKYSERFDNKKNELVEGVFNPENWGRRLVKEEPDYTALLKPVGTWQENYLEEYFLGKIKEVLQFGNDAQAIRFMEKYYESKKEQNEK
jgi:hypothetical protein